MVARKFSNTAVATTLSAGIGAGDGSLVVLSATGWPSAPFILVIEPDLGNEELILVGSKSGTSFTSLTRGFGGTSAVAHNAASVIKHVAVAEDHSLTFTHVHVPGTDDTTQVDHGGLGGLSDDDHGQYLKDKLGGGVPAEVPTHSHADAASAGQVDHGDGLGLADDDHTQYHTDARAATWHDDSEHAAINHDALTGLGDDDHPLYTRKDILNAKGSMYGASAVDVPASIGVGVDGQVPIADASAFAGVRWDTMTIFVRKASQDNNNTTTLASDSELFFPIGANEEWGFEFGLDTAAFEPPSIKMAILGPSGAMIRAHEGAGIDISLNIAMFSIGHEDNTGIGRRGGQAFFKGFIQNSTTPGNCGLWFAQFTSDASSAAIEVTSYMIAHRLN